jgi:hypothetical protein
MPMALAINLKMTTTLRSGEASIYKEGFMNFPLPIAKRI